MAVHKGTELNNVNETWQQNEQQRQSGDDSTNPTAADAATTNNELEQTIKKEAADYDNASKEDRVLGGERATVDDDRNGE